MTDDQILDTVAALADAQGAEAGTPRAEAMVLWRRSAAWTTVPMGFSLLVAKGVSMARRKLGCFAVLCMGRLLRGISSTIQSASIAISDSSPIPVPSASLICFCWSRRRRPTRA